jgi:1,4-dihydroxy-2-naphthoyl-CoA synthase
MEYQTIIDERHGAVARTIPNRPRYKNAQSRLMIEELDRAFVDAILLGAMGYPAAKGQGGDVP